MGAGLAAHLPRKRMARPLDRRTRRRRLEQLDRSPPRQRPPGLQDGAPDRRRRAAHAGRGTRDPAGSSVLLPVEDQSLSPDHRPAGHCAGGPDGVVCRRGEDERPPAARRLGGDRQADAAHRQEPARPDGRGHLRSPGPLPGPSRQSRARLGRNLDAAGRGRDPTEGLLASSGAASRAAQRSVPHRPVRHLTRAGARPVRPLPRRAQDQRGLHHAERPGPDAGRQLLDRPRAPSPRTLRH